MKKIVTRLRKTVFAKSKQKCFSSRLQGQCPQSQEDYRATYLLKVQIILAPIEYGFKDEKQGTLKRKQTRRDGKGRRCCLGDRINSIRCRTTDLLP